MEQLIEFAGNHFLLVASFFFVLTLLLMNIMQGGGSLALSAQQAVALLNKDNAIVVDTRSEEDFDAGHIVNSIHVDAADLKGSFEPLASYKDQPLLIYCASGVGSTAIARQLRRAGFSETFSLRGGVNGWRADNLPLARKD